VAILGLMFVSVFPRLALSLVKLAYATKRSSKLRNRNGKWPDSVIGGVEVIAK
jgi:hypothetical protein